MIGFEICESSKFGEGSGLALIVGMRHLAAQSECRGHRRLLERGRGSRLFDGHRETSQMPRELFPVGGFSVHDERRVRHAIRKRRPRRRICARLGAEQLCRKLLQQPIQHFWYSIHVSGSWQHARACR